MLIARAALGREAAAPQRRIDLGDRRAAGRDVPAVKWPEMHASSEALADEAQPGNTGMGRFRHRSLNIEVKHRFGAAGALLGQAPPARIASASGAIAHHALADEIDIGVIVV